MSHVTLLLPELRRIVPFACAPIVARWVSRGDKSMAQRGRDAVLLGCFEFIGNGIPHAALARSLESSDASDGVWINADPAYVIADAVTVRMLAFGSIGIDDDENVELAKSLRPLFGDAGFPLEVTPSGRWQLRGPKQAQLPSFAHPYDAMGDDLATHLPRGANERQWRHLLNEAQIILHNHPVNAQRTARGATPVNSVWFWGAGALPAWVRSKYSDVASFDPDVLALAKMSGVNGFDELYPETFRRNDERHLLIDADDADHLVHFVETVDTALCSKSVDALRVASNDGSRVIYRSSHRRRFWRSVKPLPTA